MHFSNTLPVDNNFKAQIMIFLVLDSVVAFCTIIGNGMFMTTLLLKRSLHTPPNTLLGALCLSDLLVGILVQPLYIIDFSYKLAGNCEEPFLKAKTIMTWFCVGLSFQHILLISLDRYTALHHPFWYHAYATCKRHIRICMLSSILPVSATSVSTALFVTHHLRIRNYILSAVLLASLLAVGFTNWKVFCMLRHQKRTITVVGEIEEENRRRIYKRRQERSKTYVIVVVVILFFVCYLPIFVQFFLRFWQKKVFRSIATYRSVDIWTDFFMLFNSVVNPIIYYARMKEIRKAVSTLLCRRLCIAAGEECSNAATN